MKRHSIKYNKIHSFLRSKFGKANKCESTDCSKKSKLFEYARIKGKKYEFKRENFIMLCRGCHIKYDVKPETIKKRRLMMLGNKRGFKKGSVPWNKGKHPEYVQGENHPMFGKTHSLETRNKLSLSHLGQRPWNKGKPFPKMIGNTNGFKKGNIPWNKGLKKSLPSEET